MLSEMVFMTMKPKRSKKVLEHVASRMAAGICLVHDCKEEQECCGRCQGHYNRYAYLKSRMTKAQAFEFDKEIYLEGTWVYPQEVRDWKRNDPDVLAARRSIGVAS